MQEEHTTEKYTIPKDIKVFCVKADAFPEGIQESHNKLKSLISDIPHRKFYGISYPVDGQIMYMTGVEDDSLGEKECIPFTIRAGEYISTVIEDYEKDTSVINTVFDELLKRPDIAPDGYCLEIYSEDSKDLRCLVPLK